MCVWENRGWDNGGKEYTWRLEYLKEKLFLKKDYSLGKGSIHLTQFICIILVRDRSVPTNPESVECALEPWIKSDPSAPINILWWFYFKTLNFITEFGDPRD